MGGDKVLRKMFEMFGWAERSVTIVLPWNSAFNDQIVRRLQDLERRNVEVRLMTDSGEAASLLRKARLRKPILAVDRLVDESEALIGLRDYSACGSVDNRFIAAHFKEFLTLMWNNSQALQ